MVRISMLFQTDIKIISCSHFFSHLLEFEFKRESVESVLNISLNTLLKCKSTGCFSSSAKGIRRLNGENYYRYENLHASNRRKVVSIFAGSYPKELETLEGYMSRR